MNLHQQLSASILNDDILQKEDPGAVTFQLGATADLVSDFTARQPISEDDWRSWMEEVRRLHGLVWNARVKDAA